MYCSASLIFLIMTDLCHFLNRLQKKKLHITPEHNRKKSHVMMSNVFFLRQDTDVIRTDSERSDVWASATVL